MPIDPSLRRQLLQALAQKHSEAQANGEQPTPERDDAYIKAASGGKVNGMEDLIPSTADQMTGTQGIDLPSAAISALNAPGEFGRGVLGAPAAVGHALAHPVDTAGDMTNMFFNALFSPVQGTDVSGQSAGGRGGMRTNPMPPGGMVTPQTPGSVTPAVADQAMRGLVGSAMMGAGPLGALFGGGLAGGPEGAGQALGGYGMVKGLGELGARTVTPAARRLGLFDPRQRAANLMNNDFLPAVSQPGAMGTAEGGTAQIAPNAAAMAPPGMTTANPTLAELMGASGTKALSSAVEDNPALVGPMMRRVEARGLEPSNPAYEPDLAGGIRQATKQWADPKYDAMRANYPAIETGSTRTGITIGEGMNMPPETAAYKGATRELAQGRLATGGVNRPLFVDMNPAQKVQFLSQPIPGFENTPAPGITDILSTPVVQNALEKAATEQGLGIGPEPGEPYSFAQAQRAIEVLQEKADRSWKTGDRTAGKQLGVAAQTLSDEVARQVPEYGPVQQEYARRMEMAKNAETRGGTLKMPTTPGVAPPTNPISVYLRYAARPLLKATIGAAHGRTMAGLADMLTSQGGDIGDVLNELKMRAANGPVQPTPPWLAPSAGVLAGANQH